MPINSRNKGAQFERDVARILNEFFQENGIDYETKRNLDQYQQKDQCDLNIPFHSLECKFYKEGDWLKTACWEQVCESSGHKIPVLIYKFNKDTTDYFMICYFYGNPEYWRNHNNIWLEGKWFVKKK